LNSEFKGKKIWLQAMGCRTNLYEADALACELMSMGADITDSIEEADAAVLNTCTVTSTADRKVRQLIRRAKRINPSIFLVVCGCWAQRVSEKYASETGADLLVGNRMKSRIPGMIGSFFRNEPVGGSIKEDVMRSQVWDDLFMSSPVLHTRAFVKVQDGCSHFCSYCIIPYVRGRSVSRPSQDVEKEVRKLVDSGTTEVILTGVHLGIYRDESGVDLAGLLRRISRIEGVERIRFGSIEPFTLKEELLSAMAGSPVFCPHLHIPLQSGDDEILASMRRGYSSSGFLNVLEKARTFLGEDVHISSDVMVGFPGEENKAFLNTIKVMEKAGFGKVHVFPFSAREGTPAFNFSGVVDSREIHRRVDLTIETGKTLLDGFGRSFLGREMEVLIERSGPHAHGLISRFLRVRFDTDNIPGSFQKVKLLSFDGEIFEGVQVK